MKGKRSKLSIGRKALISMLLLALQSCALIGSYQKFSLDQDPKLTFSERMTYSGDSGGVLFFFDEGTMLLVRPMSSDVIEEHLEDINYNIYSKMFSDYRFDWGRYQVKEGFIQIELLEKVHQWGFMGITKWNAVVKNQGKEIEILPGPVNRKVRTVSYPTFNYKGEPFFQDSMLQHVIIEPEKAWVNK